MLRERVFSVLPGDRAEHQDLSQGFTVGCRLRKTEVAALVRFFDEGTELVENGKALLGKVGVARPDLQTGHDVGELLDSLLRPRSFAQIRVLLLELFEAFQQISRRILALGVARQR